MDFYKKSVEATIAELSTSQTGISSEQFKKAREQYGPNAMTIKGEPLWRKIIKPFVNVFVGVLAIAGVLSIATGHAIDAVIIIAIIVVIAIIDWVQQYSTERVLRSLKQHDVQMVSTYRDGDVTKVEAEELVPGDVIVLTEGEKVPADARLIHAENVRSDEAMLTGESLPITKHVRALEKEHPVYERTNTIFQGSFLVSGNATAVVTATGVNTEFGRLAQLSTSTPPASPAQEKLDALISRLIVVIIGIVVTVFSIALWRGMETLEALRFVMSLAVAAVPEGLPVAVAVVLALGMRRLAAYKALVRSMTAVENVGIITTIASDKTGTLTKNKLTVQETWAPAGSSHQSIADWSLLTINDSKGAATDPLDTAIASYVTKQKATHPHGRTWVEGFPFDQALTMSGNVWQVGERFEVVIKGAPERIIQHCYSGDAKGHQAAESQLAEFTSLGYRVIALARVEGLRKGPEKLEDINFKSMKFVGLIAIADELRPEAKRAIKAAQAAGITVRMITGDHAETAYAIGRKLGLAKTRQQVLDCRDIDNLSEKELAQKVSEIRVFARVVPEAKHRILGVLKTKHITAMTGDGVNDVPALTNAHVGVAMGSGSQIARESGDIVLLDDNFATIVRAVEGGRVIFDNIRRMITYMMTTTVGTVTTVTVALLIGIPLPLVAVQILWINLVTDTIFAIPLGLEPAEEDVMKRPPRGVKQPILERHMIARVILVGLTMAVITLGVYMYFLANHNVEYAQTMAFATMVVSQWANALNLRSEFVSFVKRLRVRNVPIHVGGVIAVALQSLVMFGPLAPYLHVVAVPLLELFVSISIAFVGVVVTAELHKLYCRYRLARREKLV